MRIAVVIALATALLSVGCSASVGTINHDPQAAAREAEEFVRLCVVDDDVPAAYAMFGEEAQEQVDLATFTQQMEIVNEGGRPKSVRATSWESLPGERALVVFLVGTDVPREYYYRVVMEGTLGTGYRPFAVFRGDGPYPESSLRQDLK